MIDTSAVLPHELPADPFPILASWFDDALRAGKVPNPNAMILATATAAGLPSARVLLCKGVDTGAGELIFYTNYDSRKGRELARNPRAAAVFHWDHASRQARIEGTVALAESAESDAYFASRPLISRLGAWTSAQSETLTRREDLLAKFEAVAQRFGISAAQVLSNDAKAAVPRPPNWGGYHLKADSVELWLGHAGRLHDRALWTRDLSEPHLTWRACRLQP